MNQNLINDNINKDEYEGEKLISRFRMVLSIIYVISIPIISIVRNSSGFGYLPWRAYIFTTIFILYSLFLFIYLLKNNKVHSLFKYFVITIDILLISACIWLTCTYPEICPPIIYLSIQAQIYIIIVLIGSFRYSVPSAIFSGIFAGICYLIVVFSNGSALNLPYKVEISSEVINVSFPLYNESLRSIAMIVSGVIAGIASKRYFKFFNNMLETQIKSAESSNKIVEQTKVMAEIIQKSTDEIFISSKNIFSTANNQAASVQEIESTMNENSNIAEEIANKTSDVANIASKMESDVNHGFSILERNVVKLETIKNKNDGIITGIISLGNKIIKIRDIIKNINIITDQTKVIAFNAALEAASAGENGKRFAVVASEVNRLADDVSLLTKQIRDNVEEVQSSSSSLIVSSEESADKIAEGNNLIKELEEIFTKIRFGAENTSNQAQIITHSTQKQLRSTEQINSAIIDISKGLSNFIQSTRAATASAEDLNLLTKELGELLTAKNSRDGV